MQDTEDEIISFCVMHSHVLSPMAGRFSQKAAVNRYTLCWQPVPLRYDGRACPLFISYHIGRT